MIVKVQGIAVPAARLTCRQSPQAAAWLCDRLRALLEEGQSDQGHGSQTS